MAGAARMDVGHAFGDDWAGRLITAAVGGAAAAIVAWWGGRKQVQGNLQAEAHKAAKLACDELTGVVGVLREEISRIRADQLAERRECDIKLAGLQLQIDALMGGPIATYGGGK